MTDRIEKTIDLKAPVDRVWRALTDHVEFGDWFRVSLEAPFVVGQSARGKMRYPGYEHLTWEVMVTRMDAPNVFAFTWHPYAVDETVDYSKETPTLVEFHLAPTASGARLTVTESGFENVPEHRRAEAFMRNDGGWTAQVENIRAHVES